MFDRLIESDTSDLKPRRRYFLISSVVVGLLFVSAVIFSIYASEIGLGSSTIELSQLLPPNEMAQAAPEQTNPRIASTQTRDKLPRRVIDQQDVSEEPITVPDRSSTMPNKYQSRPYGDYVISDIDRNPIGSSAGSAIPNGSPNGTGSIDPTPKNISDSDRETSGSEPPPLVKTSRPQYVGVVNGRATYLPKPVYPAPALSMGIEGKVDVQITIDENGSVISARAATGNPLLRPAAENAALKAKFKPTTLNNVPVKVTGIIVYNFSKN